MRLPLLARLVQFRNELVMLWRAFVAAETPLHLKALMLLVPLYLLSPVDLIPDMFPILGWIDDAIVIPMLVSWIVSLLPQRATHTADDRSRSNGGPTIDGTWRRL
jgi:uncharacterized membrane protein YkvA (DUF1232 family)